MGVVAADETATTPTNETATNTTANNSVSQAVDQILAELGNRSNTTATENESSLSANASKIDANGPANSTTSNPGYLDRIDSNTVLVSMEYNEFDGEDGGEAVITIKSEKYQQIRVTDSQGAMRANGTTGADIPTEAKWVDRGDMVTFRLEVTKHRGFAGFTVGTSENLRGYELVDNGIPEKESETLANTSGIAGYVGGIVLAVSMFVVGAFLVLRKEGGEPRVAR
ncbi:hypothetical protein [Haloprofundus salinisoli]|uniref:hypothetical protein n=1 Tax=Haloprofundus salinisoli TaxID=2876193 RepID=UPI001CCB4F9B|nr:hypothetical protein [Haloprofundus salinisoli]